MKVNRITRLESLTITLEANEIEQFRQILHEARIHLSEKEDRFFFMGKEEYYSTCSKLLLDLFKECT